MKKKAIEIIVSSLTIIIGLFLFALLSVGLLVGAFEIHHPDVYYRFIYLMLLIGWLGSLSLIIHATMAIFLKEYSHKGLIITLRIIAIIAIFYFSTMYSHGRNPFNFLFPTIFSAYYLGMIYLFKFTKNIQRKFAVIIKAMVIFPVIFLIIILWETMHAHLNYFSFCAMIILIFYLFITDYFFSHRNRY